MEVQTGTADFSNPISGSGPRSQIVPIIFPTAVQTAAVGLTGYTVAYGDNNDHHVGLIDVQVAGEVNDNVVIVTATLGLRDWSGNWDDTYFGNIEFAVLVELAPVPPRADLIVSGMETNQAVQFFHAETFLTSAPPDNAIPLYAGKNTGLRIYPDWDAALGLPLAALTGSVSVTGSAGAALLSPLNPAGTIAPRSADTINMAQIEHTLNFLIPAALCSGALDVTVQLWDQANPSSKSGVFSRTLVFNVLPTLNMFVVGVNYTAQGLNLPAPTQAAFTGAGFAYLQKVYPQGSIAQTGYSTIAYGENVNFTIGSQGGCGNGMGDLLDQMDDLRGGSSDIYMAVLPPLAQIQTAGSNIGGCARSGVGAVFVDQLFDVPHETGHTLGRSHAPCDPGQCTPPPANVDPNYPSYGALPAGSIGVFGFDPVGYQVFNPASTFDTMAYRFPQWISAYTYLAIAGAGHPSEGGSGGAGGGLGSPHALTGVPIELLFLNLAVHRDRTVRRRPSFHYAALPRSAKLCGEFVIELLDVDREVLICTPLSCDCDEVGHHCWPKRFRSAVPYPAEARWLLVYEDERKLYEEWIPRPPRVVAHVQQDGDVVNLSWRAEHEGDDDDFDCCVFWYLVQWFDPEDETWRGVAPRTRATEMRLPPDLLRGGEALRLRVLASCGIATGMAIVEARGNGRGKPTLQLGGQLGGQLGPGGENALGNQITATLVTPGGRHLTHDSAGWVVGGREAGRGASLDLRCLPQGSTELRAFVRSVDGQFSRSWTVRRDGARFTVEHAGPEESGPPPDEAHVHPHPPPHQH